MGKPIKYCSLCGEQLEFYFKHDCDHMGPMSSGHWEQKEHTCKSSLKKMCLNCEFYTNSCNNEKVKQTVLDKNKYSSEAIHNYIYRLRHLND